MKICKYQVMSVIIIVFFSIVVLCFIFWPYMWEGEFLSKWASVVTILSLIGVPIAYFSKQYQKEKERKQKEIDERNRASRNLYGELRDALDAIEGTKFPKDLLDIKFDDKTMTYTNRFLNHDMYDSLIFSGKVSFLRYELQQKIQDIFKRIKHHNYYLRLVAEIQDKEKGNLIPETTHRYYELLDKDEKYLLENIPDIMKKLKEEFEFELPN